MIPRKLALRIWAACLSSQAVHLRGLTSDAARQLAGRRGGAAGRAGFAGRAAGRLDVSNRLAQQAHEIRSWIDQPEGPGRGGDLDPAIVGLVCAYLHQHGPACVAVREWIATRGHHTDGIPSDDAVGIIRSILEIH